MTERLVLSFSLYKLHDKVNKPKSSAGQSSGHRPGCAIGQGGII
jgi:hypothetical protein